MTEGPTVPGDPGGLSGTQAQTQGPRGPGGCSDPGDPPHKGLHWVEKRGAGGRGAGGEGGKEVSTGRTPPAPAKTGSRYEPSAGGPLRPMLPPAASGSLLPAGLGQDRGERALHRAEKTRASTGGRRRRERAAMRRSSREPSGGSSRAVSRPRCFLKMDRKVEGVKTAGFRPAFKTADW